MSWRIQTARRQRLKIEFRGKRVFVVCSMECFTDQYGYVKMECGFDCDYSPFPDRL